AVARAGVGIGAALADGDSIARLMSTGMAGAAGRDDLVTTGEITLRDLSAHSDAVSVSLDLAGSERGIAIGAALVHAEAEATASATGMSGGDDKDRLHNAGSITVET